MSNRSIDRFDRQLLQLLQQDSALTADALSETVGLSASAIQRRITRLRADGFIVKQIALVNPELVGNPIFFVVALEVEHEQLDLLNSLRRWMSQQASIQQIYYVTGSADFILIVTAADMKSFDAFMQKLTTGNPNVRRFTTNVVLGTYKRSLFIPIESH